MIDIVFMDHDEAGDVPVALVVDAVPEERHRLSATATEIEVERGVDITDHVRPNRDPLTLDVVISDTPLFFLDPDEELTRAKDAWEQLDDARTRALLAIVTTKWKTYEDMVLTEAIATRTAADGSWIHAELTFMPIRQVSTQTVEDPVPARAHDRRETDRGSQATTEAPEQLQSVSYQGLAALGLFR